MAQRRNKKLLEEQYRPIGIKALSAAGQWQGTAENADTEPEQDRALEQNQPKQTFRSETQMGDFEQQGKRLADKTAKAGHEAAAEAANGAGQAAALMREVNVTLIDMAKANTEAMFDFAHRLATAQPSELPQVWAELGRKQLELTADQSRELTKLGQRIAGVGTEPFTRNLRNLG
jgi:hypothetical protein